MSTDRSRTKELDFNDPDYNDIEAESDNDEGLDGVETNEEADQLTDQELIDILWEDMELLGFDLSRILEGLDEEDSM